MDLQELLLTDEKFVQWLLKQSLDEPMFNQDMMLDCAISQFVGEATDSRCFVSLSQIQTHQPYGSHEAEIDTPQWAIAFQNYFLEQMKTLGDDYQFTPRQALWALRGDAYKELLGGKNAV